MPQLNQWFLPVFDPVDPTTGYVGVYDPWLVATSVGIAIIAALRLYQFPAACGEEHMEPVDVEQRRCGRDGRRHVGNAPRRDARILAALRVGYNLLVRSCP